MASYPVSFFFIILYLILPLSLNLLPFTCKLPQTQFIDLNKGIISSFILFFMFLRWLSFIFHNPFLIFILFRLIYFYKAPTITEYNLKCYPRVSPKIGSCCKPCMKIFIIRIIRKFDEIICPSLMFSTHPTCRY